MKIWTTSTSDILPLQRTKTCFDSGQVAKWDEHFVVKIENVSSEFFYVEVMDHNDILDDRLIGKAKFACADLGPTTAEAWIKIYRDDGSDAGEVLIAARVA